MSKLLSISLKIFMCICFLTIMIGCSSSDDKSVDKSTKTTDANNETFKSYTDSVKTKYKSYTDLAKEKYKSYTDTAKEKYESYSEKSLAKETKKIVSNLTLKSKDKATPKIDKTEKLPKDLKLLVDRGVNVAPDAIIKKIELKQKKQYEDFIDLGTCYIWIGNFSKSVDAYEEAARIAKTPEQLGGALYNKAVAMAYVNINQSLPITDFASRVLPENLEIARLRLALHQKSSNQLGLAVAQDHLSKLDPSVTGHEVMEPATTALIIVAVVGAYLTIDHVTCYALTPPEDRKYVVNAMMNGYYGSMSSLVKTPAATFSKKLVEGAI